MEEGLEVVETTAVASTAKGCSRMQVGALQVAREAAVGPVPSLKSGADSRCATSSDGNPTSLPRAERRHLPTEPLSSLYAEKDRKNIKPHTPRNPNVHPAAPIPAPSPT